MSVIRQTDQAPETVDTKPVCECVKYSEPFDGRCSTHPRESPPADGRYRHRASGGVYWLCRGCLWGHDDKWERIS